MDFRHTFMQKSDLLLYFFLLLKSLLYGLPKLAWRWQHYNTETDGIYQWRNFWYRPPRALEHNLWICDNTSMARKRKRSAPKSHRYELRIFPVGKCNTDSIAVAMVFFFGGLTWGISTTENLNQRLRSLWKKTKNQMGKTKENENYNRNFKHQTNCNKNWITIKLLSC